MKVGRVVPNPPPSAPWTSFSGVIKTENVETKNFGATLSLEGTFETTKSIERSKIWTRVEFEFDTGPLATIKFG